MQVKVTFKHSHVPAARRHYAERIIHQSLERIAHFSTRVDATISEDGGLFTVKYGLTTLTGKHLVSEAQHSSLRIAVRDATTCISTSLHRLKDRQMGHRDRATPRHEMGLGAVEMMDTAVGS